MFRRALAAILTGMVVVSAAAAAPADTVRIGLLGNSYLASVAAALDAVGLPHQQLRLKQLLQRDPGSLDVLFIAYDALASAGGEAPGGAARRARFQWLREFRRRGGVLCTFYTLPAPLQELLGITQGEYLSQQYAGQFASIRSNGVIPRLPAVMAQRSNNIITASPRGDSVQVVAQWYDANGTDTGQPAVLLGPGGIHLTHVLLSDDVEGAAQLYSALLSHFYPEVWPQAVGGALRAAERAGGGRGAPGRRVRAVSRVRKKLAESARAVREGREALGQGRFGAALQCAFRARRLGAEAYARGQGTRKHEMRAVWIHDPFGVSDWGWERSMKKLADAGFNAVIANMFDAGMTSYPSDVLPVDPRVAQEGDQLAALVRAAHHNGIEVHAWKVNYNLAGADTAFVARMRREGRLQANVAGKETLWLCPSDPRNVALEAESMLEVVRNYAVDGIHFDYIRYPGPEQCYCQGCRMRFQSETGHVVRNWPEDVVTGDLVEPFQQWRQDQITRLVRTVAVQARQLRPEIQISAAVFSNWPETRYTVGQDWIRWIREGYLDFVCPMDYIADTEQFTTRVRDQVDWVDGRVPLYIGIGSWQIGDPTEVLRQIAFTREAGADGFVLFDYSPKLAERMFPLFREGITAQAAQPPHVGPRVYFDVTGPTQGTVMEGAAFHPAGAPLELTAQVVASTLFPKAQARITWETLSGRTVRELGEVRAADGRPQHRVLHPPPGDYRPAVAGKYRDARGKKHSFARRGPVVRVRDAAFLDSLEREYGPPQVPGGGIPVGVYRDGYGSGALTAVLRTDSSLAVFQLRHLSAAALAETRVLVIPQPHNRWAIDRLTRDRLRSWIRAGGGLLVTHDMVGMRGAQPVVPEVCRRGIGYPRSAQWRIVAEHPAVSGVPAGLQLHSYYDHITLEPGPDGQVLAVDDQQRPVLVVGGFGEGRYAALGLAPGLGADDQEVAPAGAERTLLEALVRWLAAP